VPPTRFEMTQLADLIGLTKSGLFITRPNGEKAYEILKEELRKVPSGEALVLSFPPNQLVDASFADETAVKLGQETLRGEYGDRALLLEGLTRDSLKNIRAAISLQKLKLPLLAVERSGTWQVAGHLEDHLLETLKLVGELGRMTAAELMSILDLAVNTASTRLKRLHNMHLVRREHEISERGLQYIYYFWRWDETT
jgi:hypothetical protein